VLSDTWRWIADSLVSCIVLGWECYRLNFIFYSAGYPLVTHFTSKMQSTKGGFNLGGINATGQVRCKIIVPIRFTQQQQIPVMHFGLIDPDTPTEAYTHKSYTDDSTMQLVFSDEFNTDGRSFYPGDDPFWEAPSLHYWGVSRIWLASLKKRSNQCIQTNNLEWYDPDAITTKGGALRVTLSKEDPESNHNMSYRGGLMTSWNKVCGRGPPTIAFANNVVSSFVLQVE